MICTFDVHMVGALATALESVSAIRNTVHTGILQLVADGPQEAPPATALALSSCGQGHAIQRESA